MSKRELTPEREKKRSDFKSGKAPESSEPPTEDAPEQEVVPEFEGEPLETETKITRDSLVTTKPKRKK